MAIMLAILMYALGVVATISAASIFGVTITIGQSASLLILFSLLVSIVKNF